ncbi:CMRF35-like molecule 7 [Rhynchonycteris naso]
MWLPSALLLLSLPGCLFIQGPAIVRGQERGSLTVQCSYKPGWESHKKWWCRGAIWYKCRILVQTTGSQQKVQRGRVSITDNQRDRLITVTMKDLRRSDQDTYQCGIEKSGTDLGTSIKIFINTGSMTPENLISGTNSSNDPGMSSSSQTRNHYMLLVFVKVPVLLTVVGAVLWLKGSQRVSREQREQPIYIELV